MYYLSLNTWNNIKYKGCTTFILSLVFIFNVAAQGNLLQKKISIELQNVKLSEAIKAIETAANCSIAYSETFVDTDRIVTVRAQNIPLSDVLKQVFGNLSNGTKVRGNQITLGRPIDTNTIGFNVNALEIDEVEVFGERNQKPEKLDAITRLPLQPSEQIQSISIISEKLIRQQGVLTIRDGVQNVPGVYTFSTYNNTKESIASRGFRGIPTLKNGVRVYEDGLGQGFITDMEGVESIQVLKGSNAITQGLSADIGNSGGVVNIVTKVPKFENTGYVSMRAGSWGLLRPAFDVQGVINEEKTLAFRINGAYENRGSYRSVIEGQKIYVNPSLAWKPDAKTDVFLELDYLNDSRTPDAGTVNLADMGTNAIYSLPYDSYLGFENDRYTTKNMTYTLRLNRRMTDQLSLRVAYFGSTLKTTNQSVYLANVRDREANIRARSIIGSTVENNNSTLQVDLVGTDIYTGGLSHTLQVGMDYKASMIKSYLPSNNLLRIDTVDIFEHPTNVLPTTSRLQWNGIAVTDVLINSYGIMAQDVVTVGKYVKTVLGLRYSASETQSNAVYGTTRGDAWNPQIGVIVSPWKGLNVFGSYTSNTNINATGIIDREGKPLGRSRYDQFEVGAKTQWLNDRLRFNLTLYKINNHNLPMQIYEGNVPTPFYEKGGNDERKGVEVELTGRPLPQLDVIAGYAYIDARYKDHTSYYFNSAPLNTPKQTYNVYANYLLDRGALKGLSVGAGAYYIGKRPVSDWSRVVDETHGIQPGLKPFDIAAYTTVNVQAGYGFSRHWDLRLFFNNVFNEIGFNAYRTLYINQTDPRNFSAILTYKF
ncbi:TonB-dependent siderophore receptor [Sphingobacterium chuzhouense]|uniref:TonB-dependent siderophore receptor n=1 Tax=Sphingobacterium chuzhouense TaxID=1742264 RepID=A0ABR7XXH5_9SPHI|nr:TonB-dependent siderophore receptor [Sphingobacterium chuzhouense]MBD1423727.1 TonB-dependent siderophore receptor [Sphingobacterium chuzhouense]